MHTLSYSLLGIPTWNVRYLDNHHGSIQAQNNEMSNDPGPRTSFEWLFETVYQVIT